MPIRKVKGGFKWGSKGYTYPTREGAVKQAQAAYSNGYTGKALLELHKEAVSHLSTLNKLVPDNTIQIHGKVHPRRKPKKHQTKEEHFAVKESDSGETVDLPENRIYVESAKDAPSGVFVQPGPRGGEYYVPGDQRKVKIHDDKDTAGSMSTVQDTSHKNPTRVEEEHGKTSTVTEDGDREDDTLEKIKIALSEANLQPSVDGTDGYHIFQSHGDFDIVPISHHGKKKKFIAHKIEEAMHHGGLRAHRDGYTTHVKPKSDSNRIKELFEINRAYDLVDTLAISAYLAKTADENVAFHAESSSEQIMLSYGDSW